ncbi:MAG: hypothetical protein LBR44_11105 [Clostridiales Family XIII bacterium]|jgi:hypothetical protein|nr:hypothetical protein [Clostridiales Family XIII bacterium]
MENKKESYTAKQVVCKVVGIIAKVVFALSIAGIVVLGITAFAAEHGAALVVKGHTVVAVPEQMIPSVAAPFTAADIVPLVVVLILSGIVIGVTQKLAGNLFPTRRDVTVFVLKKAGFAMLILGLFINPWFIAGAVCFWVVAHLVRKDAIAYKEAGC